MKGKVLTLVFAMLITGCATQASVESVSMSANNDCATRSATLSQYNECESQADTMVHEYEAQKQQDDT